LAQKQAQLAQQQALAVATSQNTPPSVRGDAYTQLGYANVPQDELVTTSDADITSRMKEFEAANPQFKGKNGTAEYGAAFSTWTPKTRERGYQYVGMLGEGKGSVFNQTTGTFEQRDIGGSPSQKVLGRVPGSEVAAIGALKAVGKEAREVEDLTATFNDRIGPIKGRLGPISVKWFDDKEFSNFHRKVNKLGLIVYGLSGKVVTDAERAWLRETVLPALSQPSENFLGAVQELQKFIQNKVDSNVQAFEDLGYNVGKLGGGQKQQTAKMSDIDAAKQALKELPNGTREQLKKRAMELMNGG